MEKKTYDLDISRRNKRIVIFNHNEQTYYIKAIIDFKYLNFFSKNKDELSNKELAIACITMSNNNLEIVVNDFSKGQILFILNKYIKLNNVSKTTITSYNQFSDQIQSYSNEMLKKMQSQLNETIKDSIPDIMNTMEQVRNISKNIKSIIIPPIKVALEIKKQVEKIFQETNLKHWKETFDKFKIVAEQFQDYISEYDKLLMKLGYPPIEFDISDVKYIVENKENDNICIIIDSLIIKEYCDDSINRIFKRWEKYSFLTKRIKLLEDSFYAYRIEKYSLSIPLMLAELEGTVVDFFNIKGKSNMMLYKEYVLNALENNEIDDYKKITKAYFMNCILAKFFHGDKVPKFSRHAILHGADVNFGTKVNSINLILTLDIIFECMDNINKVSNM